MFFFYCPTALLPFSTLPHPAPSRCMHCQQPSPWFSRTLSSLVRGRRPVLAVEPLIRAVSCTSALATAGGTQEPAVAQYGRN